MLVSCVCSSCNVTESCAKVTFRQRSVLCQRKCAIEVTSCAAFSQKIKKKKHDTV